MGHLLTRLGVYTASPVAFLVLIAYAGLWYILKPETFEWHAVATLGGDRGPCSDGGPAWPWPIDPAEPRFIGEHDPQTTTAPGGCLPGLPHSMWKAAFLKAF